MKNKICSICKFYTPLGDEHGECKNKDFRLDFKQSLERLTQATGYFEDNHIIKVGCAAKCIHWEKKP